MFEKWRSAIEEELSGKQAYRYAARIAQFHRIQASPGYREAAETAASLLKRDGVKAEVVSYPANNGSRFMAHRSFQEWHCKHAELWIEGEERKRIARFEEEEISVVQRSIATAPEGFHGELVLVENAEDPESYKGKDLEGKIALVRGNQFLIHDLAVVKYGAAGLIFDNLNEYPPLRTRLDMPDAVQYTSYWWQGSEKKAFGFAVSPRTGEELRERLKQGPLKVSAKMDAELYDGHYENIEYFIPGKQTEEVLLVSHLCHPYPGGQDNASGPGTLMEVMRTLTKLIENGRLPKPDLGIRFLLMPEMTGTYAYFQQHPERINCTVAALNLDMVGADQSKGGGPLCIEQPPMAVPTFTDRLAYQLFKLLSLNTGNLSGTAKYSTVNFLKTRFSGGSDHYVISDPSVGIPCPMLIQWPDKNYHTTEDSPDNLDNELMKLTGLTTCLYAFSLACGREEEWVGFLTDDAGTRYGDMSEIVKWIFGQKELAAQWEETLDFYIDYEEKVLSAYIAYAKVRGFDVLEGKAIESFIHLQNQTDAVREWAGQKADLQALSAASKTKESPPEAGMLNKVYKRVFTGPYSLHFELERLSLEDRLEWYDTLKELKPVSGYEEFIQYWIDGERSLGEVLELVKQETGVYNREFAEKFISLSLKLDLIQQN